MMFFDEVDPVTPAPMTRDEILAKYGQGKPLVVRTDLKERGQYLTTTPLPNVWTTVDRLMDKDFDRAVSVCKLARFDEHYFLDKFYEGPCDGDDDWNFDGTENVNTTFRVLYQECREELHRIIGIPLEGRIDFTLEMFHSLVELYFGFGLYIAPAEGTYDFPPFVGSIIDEKARMIHVTMLDFYDADPRTSRMAFTDHILNVDIINIISMLMVRLIDYKYSVFQINEFKCQYECDWLNPFVYLCNTTSKCFIPAVELPYVLHKIKMEEIKTAAESEQDSIPEYPDCDESDYDPADYAEFDTEGLITSL